MPLNSSIPPLSSTAVVTSNTHHNNHIFGTNIVNHLPRPGLSLDELALGVRMMRVLSLPSPAGPAGGRPVMIIMLGRADYLIIEFQPNSEAITHGKTNTTKRT